MGKMKNWAAVLFFAIGLKAFIIPNQTFAGGDFKQKLQEKVRTRNNIQYRAPQEQAAGSYIKEEECRKPASLPMPGGLISQEAPIISSYAIYKTDYKAEIEDDVATVGGNVVFEVFKKGWTKLPLVRSDVGLIDVSINRGASFVTMQGGKYYLMIDKPGRYTLDIEFLIKASRERENGPGNFSFEVMPAPISQFEFTIAESEVEIFVEPAIKLEVKREAKKTIAWAVMPNTENITVRWTKALPKETITPVKLEPKVYVDTATYAAVGDGFIRCQGSFTYSILQSEVSGLRLNLPEDVSVLDVNGRDLRDWKVSSKEGQQYLDVYFNFGIKGGYVLNLSYERKIGEGSVVAQVPWVKALGVEREKGFFGLAAATNVELTVNKIEHASVIDVKELPGAISSSTTNPILLAFKYLNHPFNITIDVTKHEELPVLVAAIDSVDYVTLQTDEGKNLTKAIYQVRNNVKQFIHIGLPKQAVLWSAFVAGKPVKPAKDRDGSILIPLEKSRLEGESLAQFPVEIVYLDKANKMSWLGGFRLSLPKTDIPISELNWSVYLPLDYAYFNFSGDIKQAQMPALWNQGARPEGSMGIQAKKAVRKDKYTYREAQQQVLEDMGFSQEQSVAMKGVLPIKIGVPEQGRLYRFAKLLVIEKESPWFSVSFIKIFKPLRWLVWVLIIAAILAVVGAVLKRNKK